MAKKFRPVLSPSQIYTILRICKERIPMSEEVMAVIAVLSPFYAKVQNEGVKAAYEIGEGKGRFESIEKKLGMGFDVGIGMNVGMGIEMNPSEKNWDLIRKLAYDKYVSNPTDCTILEIEYSNQYMYDNGLMSESEEREYEKNSLMNI